MTSLAPPQLTETAKRWDASSEYPSAVFSGIVPDGAHLDNGGYHVSIEDLFRYGNDGDYSNSRQLDQAPPVTLAGRKNSCALDMSMNPTDMAKHYTRVKKVFDDRSDPRRQYLGYVNTWDGKSVTATRFDFQGNRILTATADHKWHAHSDWPRWFCDIDGNRETALRTQRAYLSMIFGETKEQWLLQEIGSVEMAGFMVFIRNAAAGPDNGKIFRCDGTNATFVPEAQLNDQGWVYSGRWGNAAGSPGAGPFSPKFTGLIGPVLNSAPWVTVYDMDVSFFGTPLPFEVTAEVDQAGVEAAAEKGAKAGLDGAKISLEAGSGTITPAA